MRGELLQIGRRLGAGVMDPVHVVVSVRVRIVSGQCPDVSGCIHIRIVSGYCVSLRYHACAVEVDAIILLHALCHHHVRMRKYPDTPP